jgi:hypothetical protein
MEKIIRLERNSYTARTTMGGLYFPEDDYKERFCYTLEDTARAEGIKVYGETCIPGSCEGIKYKVTVTPSSRFKRDMPLIYNTDDYKVSEHGIEFSGVRLHGGNSHEDSHGCPLVAYNKINDDTIQGTAEKAVTAKIKEYLEAGHEVYLLVVNNSQSK